MFKVSSDDAAAQETSDWHNIMILDNSLPYDMTDHELI
jgi:hypothetical protein